MVTPVNLLINKFYLDGPAMSTRHMRSGSALLIKFTTGDQYRRLFTA